MCHVSLLCLESEGLVAFQEYMYELEDRADAAEGELQQAMARAREAEQARFQAEKLAQDASKLGQDLRSAEAVQGVAAEAYAAEIKAEETARLAAEARAKAAEQACAAAEARAIAADELREAAVAKAEAKAAEVTRLAAEAGVKAAEASRLAAEARQAAENQPMLHKKLREEMSNALYSRSGAEAKVAAEVTSAAENLLIDGAKKIDARADAALARAMQAQDIAEDARISAELLQAQENLANVQKFNGGDGSTLASAQEVAQVHPCVFDLFYAVEFLLCILCVQRQSAQETFWYGTFCLLNLYLASHTSHSCAPSGTGS